VYIYIYIYIYICPIFFNVEQDSEVGVVTRYLLDGPGIESRWG
jgi:hypothetical protein